MNADSTANATEDFLKHLYWLSCQIVPLAGGHFIKWTGDGFLAWFKIELHRDRTALAKAALRAAWQLSILSNVTFFDTIFSSTKPRLRHGMTYEQDAIFLTLEDDAGPISNDILGRDVNLAFRLSGIPAEFPNIVASRQLFTTGQADLRKIVNFVNWKPSLSEVSLYFKGESYGTTTLCKSDSHKSRRRYSVKALKRTLGKAIDKAQGSSPGDPDDHAFAERFQRLLLHGPPWAKSTLEKYVAFLRDEMLTPLINIRKELS